MRIVRFGQIIRRPFLVGIVFGVVLGGRAVAASGLAAEIIHQFGLAVHHRVHGVVAPIEEKGPGAVPLDEAECLAVHAFDDEFVFFGLGHRLQVVPRIEIGAVADALLGRKDHLLEPVFVGMPFDGSPVGPVSREVPFADDSRAVAVAAQCLGERGAGRIEMDRGVRFDVVGDSVAQRIAARNQSCARRRGDRRRGIGVGESHAAPRQTVECGRFVERVAVAPQFGPPQIVGEDDDDVGFLLRLLPGGYRGWMGEPGRGQRQIEKFAFHGLFRFAVISVRCASMFRGRPSRR